MVTGASFSAQQEPPAPWAGGSCCTFTAREVFFPRRSPGKNEIGICSQRSCEFGETGGGPTLRAQSRLRGTRDVHCRGWMRWFAWAGSAPLALRCAVGSLGGCGHLYRSTLARSRDATGVRCAHGSLAGGFYIFLSGVTLCVCFRRWTDVSGTVALSRDVHCRGWMRRFAWAGSAPLALRCAA